MLLTSVANIKTRVGEAFAVADATRDAALTALIVGVSKRVEEYCGRVFDSATVTEYFDGRESRELWVGRPPIASVTSVHVSTALPRVYDATTILVAGTNYDFDLSGGRIVHLSSWFAAGEKSVKVIYVGGYASAPTDIEQAVIDEILAKYQKGKGNQYHLTSVTAIDGQVGGIRFDDVPVSSLEVYDRYRLFVGIA